MKYTVRIHENGRIIEKEIEPGKNLLDFLRENSIEVKSPCNGNGRCGKCRVLVSGLDAKPGEKEKALLGSRALAKGYRLACYNKVNSDIDIYLQSADEGARIVTEGIERSVSIHPVVSKEFLILDTPGIHDQRSDIERLFASSDKVKTSVSIGVIRELGETIRREDFRVTVCTIDKRLIAVEPGDTTDKLYGIAVDIGTTTIAAYLVDLRSGKKMDVYSTLNPQKKFGADVISRIDYTGDSQASLDEMNRVIIDCINQAISILASRNNIEVNDIYAAVFVGNTTMIHFLMKLPAKNIAVSPFIPVTTQLHRISAKDMGLAINPHGYAVVFPGVAAYIGADTVAAVLSSGMYARHRISLLIDIGTNGEIVLGNKEWFLACSAAAGPAFEGANIRNGVGGINGAIDRVYMDHRGLKFTTIGGKRAIGICGSGIVDAIAGMLSTGIIDETGRIGDAGETGAQLPEDLKNRLVEIDGNKSFLILRSEECNAETDIAITQRDVRELQNAKAAIAAGIKILIKRAGIRMDDIDDVYLAGGFGSYIDIDNALKIGLLPGELKGRIRSIGNAAGSGAVLGLISSKMLKKAESIKKRINYIELSACEDFMNEYVECMMFP